MTMRYAQLGVQQMDNPTPNSSSGSGNSKLASLKPSFSTLLYGTKLELILGIRANRRLDKRPARAKITKTKSKSKPKASISPEALLAQMTPEMAAELLRALGEQT